MNWGPYRNQPEARACVGAFADEIFKQHFGVIWSADDDAQWLRPPIYDHEGFGLTLLARFDGVQPPAPPKPPDFVARLDHFLGGALTQIGQQQLDQSKMQLEAAQAMNAFIYDNAIRPINDLISRYEYVKDGITVVMDVAGVIAGAAAGVALVTVGGSLLVTVGLAAGVIAGLASLCLLVEDGRHCWFTLRGDEAGKLGLEANSDFRWIEAIGPLLAIPDLALSGRAALREAAKLAQEGNKLARESAAAAERSQQASRELRELVADRDQSAPVLGRAAAEASARAADYAKMVKKAKDAARELMLAREAVLAYGGTLWGGANYAYDPPTLARQAATSILNNPPPPKTGGLPPLPTAWTPPNQFSPLANLGLDKPQPRVSLRPEDNPWRLLDPQQNARCSTIPTSGLQLTTVVASRPKLGDRR